MCGECVAPRPAAAVVHRDPEHLCLNDPPPFFNSGTDRFQKKSWTPLLVQDLPAHANTEVILERLMESNGASEDDRSTFGSS